MRRFYLLGFALLALACNPDVKVSEEEAKTLGTKALAQYCEDKKLSPQYFRLTEAAPSGDAQWLLVYVSSGIKPTQEVAVSIGKKGDVEVHSDFEGRND